MVDARISDCIWGAAAVLCARARAAAYSAVNGTAAAGPRRQQVRRRAALICCHRKSGHCASHPSLPLSSPGATLGTGESAFVIAASVDGVWGGLPLALSSHLECGSRAFLLRARC